MSVSRVVTLLTPVFAGVAGWFSTWCAEHLPGTPQLDSGELTAIFVVGATAAGAAAVQWLNGLQKHEERVASPDYPDVTK